MVFNKYVLQNGSLEKKIFKIFEKITVLKNNHYHVDLGVLYLLPFL